MVTRYHYRITGRVQGVGFRYQSRVYANRLGITGWVRNMWDGSVELELQGEEHMIDRMIMSLNSDRFINIESIERIKINVNESERDFLVKR
ncbi:MAG: acylphosphatase [Lachnospiraceae bacterium]|nr:acylphosphatase [Lachnospiraceae bacterium]